MSRTIRSRLAGRIARVATLAALALASLASTGALPAALAQTHV
jgi:hypothetical protein